MGGGKARKEERIRMRKGMGGGKEWEEERNRRRKGRGGGKEGQEERIRRRTGRGSLICKINWVPIIPEKSLIDKQHYYFSQSDQ